MIKLNGPIGKPYADEYKPRVGQIFFPRCCYNSSNVKIPLTFGAGYYNQDVANDGDYIIIDVFSYGETIVDLLYYKSSSRGIFDLYINGVLDSSGYDCYASSSSYTSSAVTLTVPLITGWNELKLLVNGKNASSSGYSIPIGGVRLR